MQRETMSTAERAINDEFIMFQRTKGGDNVLQKKKADQSVEMINFVVRHFAGHYIVGTRDHFKEFLNRIARDMPNLQGGPANHTGAARVAHNPLDGEPKKHRHTMFGEPFAHVFKNLEDTNLWGHDAAEKDTIRPMRARKGGTPVELPAETYCSLLGQPLNTGFFPLLQVADARAESSFTKAGAPKGWKDETVLPPITVVRALKSTVQSNAHAEWAIRHSSDHVELCGS